MEPRPSRHVRALKPLGLDPVDYDRSLSFPSGIVWYGRMCRDLWAAATRGDWMLDYANHAGADPSHLVRAAAACARTALRFVPAGEDRPLLAIKAAERWADDPTEEHRFRAMDAERAVRVAAEWEDPAARAAGSASGAAAWAAWYAPGAAAGSAMHAARAHLHAEGEESAAAAHLACADEVRGLVPFLDLSDVAMA